MNEILSIDFDVKTGTLKKGLDTARDDISGFQKRIEDTASFELSLNIEKIKEDIEQAKKLLKIADDKGDFNAKINIGADINLMQQNLTQAKRELRNFLRTGEKDVSVLGKLFGSLEQKIEGVEVELIKMGRSEKEVGHLRNRMNELNDSFKSGKINAQQMAIEMNKLETEMNNIKNAPQGFQEKMGVAYSKVMGYFALITTAIYGLKSAWDEAIEGERIDIQLTNRLNGIGATVGRTKDQIKDLASVLSEATTIDEDAIVNMESRLLNFSNVQGDVFDKASKVALDYATSINDGVTPTVEDLATSIDLMGKVLNNPYDGWKKLEKAGIEFTAEEELKIQKFKKTNDIIGAQELIISKLEKQYGGSADGIKDSTEGLTNEIKNYINDVLEFFGGMLIQGIYAIRNFGKAVGAGIFIIIGAFYDMASYVTQIFWNLGKNIINNWSAVWNGLKTIGENSIDNFYILGENIYESLVSWFSKIPAKFKEYWNKVVGFLDGAPQSVKDFMGLKKFDIDTSSVEAKIKKLKPIVGDAFKGVEFEPILPKDFTSAAISGIDSLGDALNGIKDQWNGKGNSSSIIKGSGTKIDIGALDADSSGGGGKGRDKQLEAEKKRLEEVKKKEEEVAKARSSAYEKAVKGSTAYKTAIDEANKKLEEQKKKMDELKKKATETLLDIEEKMAGDKSGFQEKLAQRYLKIFDELRSALKDTGFANSSNDDIESALLGGQITGGSFDAFKKEIELIKSNLTTSELSLAVTKEKRSETEKITAEYQKQLDMSQREKDVADAKLNNRFLTNQKTGEIQFLDKNGEIIQGADRSQTKDFASQAKEIQDIANESVKIESEKIEKIAKILKDFEDERKRLRNNYYSEDKNLKIAQENMAQAFFKEELNRMNIMKTEAINLTNALLALKNAGGSSQNITNIGPTINNNQQTTQVVQVKAVSDVQQVNKSLGIGITLKK